MAIEIHEQKLLEQLLNLIEHSKKQVAIQVNSELTLLFWEVGKHINEYILQNQRADYGKRIFSTLSTKLKEKYGRNFEEKNLRRMSQFAEQFNDFQIVVPLARQLSWSHFLILLPLKNQEAQLFYAQKAVQGAWGKRELRSQINQKVFERTTISNSQLPITETLIAPNIFKDPYFLDFLGLKNDYLENDLENAILRELEQFILELGRGFAFVERQKRMIIDGEDFYLDLLFYHRRLRRLVAIELKIGKFQAKFKGQMELYLKWLNRYERQEGEEAPIGLILCAEASHEQIELLEMHKDGIIVAEYWTELPPKHELEAKLHQALLEAKERIENRRLLE
ncbi:putative nuclease of restriction endonuclease-like (RecB) superfamily [Runella defluvii]|uniref:Putative nuclease of restriction endonuclease-like (RecB) superfamily n=1 Tax=Runella defluvii TaxID=370973 RepID=A0A7W6EN82_9BACT|nr:PDDEXK nuclease domain-containing protein [Runella defluvii]MBB3836189.1 putative nuclease of restriction endonuclease-like (RecB) superfamily [Runella defluvii]